MKNLVGALLLASALLGNARADELRMVGEAHLKVLFWPVYNSRLYSADGRYQPGQRPLRLEIEYLLDIDADDLVERTREEWQHQGVASQLQEQWAQQLARLWPDVAASDVLSVVIDAQQTSTFYRNGELLGVIDDPEFGQRFLGIWLSPDTSRPELRLAMIGAE